MSGMHLACYDHDGLVLRAGEMTGVMLAGSFATWTCSASPSVRLFDSRVRRNAVTPSAPSYPVLGGVTEPGADGICLSHVRCFWALMVGSFVGGAYGAGNIANLTQYVITSANFLSVLSYVGGTNANFIQGIIASIISLVVAAVCTYLFVALARRNSRNASIEPLPFRGGRWWMLPEITSASLERVGREFCMHLWARCNLRSTVSSSSPYARATR